MSEILKNPLIGVLLALSILIIGIVIFKLMQPDFNVGLKLGGNIGKYNGEIDLNLYENYENSCPCGVTDDGSCADCVGPNPV